MSYPSNVPEFNRAFQKAVYEQQVLGFKPEQLVAYLGINEMHILDIILWSNPITIRDYDTGKQTFRGVKIYSIMAHSHLHIAAYKPPTP